MTVARLIVLAALLSACAAAEPSQTLDVSLTLVADEGAHFSGACQGTGGYEDIAPGMDVTLKDGEGAIIGSEQLPVGQADDNGDCRFEVTFADVPEADFYVLETGDRGDQTYSQSDLEGQDWTVALTIGG